MNPSEQDRASQLGRLWDDLARDGALFNTDAELLADIQFVQEVTAVPFPPPALRTHIWERVGQRSLSATVSTTIVMISPNGVAHGLDASPTVQPPGLAPLARQRTAINWAKLYWMLAIGVLAGFGAGFAAGIWTRLAMRLAGFLTSDRNRGLLTENDAVVGEITVGGTLFLAIFAGVVGVGGGLLYIVIRTWLPAQRHLRAVTYGALLFAVFGFVLMDEHNPDYQLFGPAWLNVGSFSLTYLVYGVLASLAAEHLIIRMPRWTMRRTKGRGALLASVAMTPFGAIGLLAIPIILISGFGNAAAAILASILLLLGISRVIQLPVWNTGALSPALRRTGALAILVPGLIGVFLTIQGVVGIFIG